MKVYVVTEQCIHEEPIIEGVFHDRARADELADGLARTRAGALGPGKYFHAVIAYDTATGQECDGILEVITHDADIEKIDETLRELACGDSSCIVARRGGMSTNGGCRCFERGQGCSVCREFSRRAGRVIRLLHRKVSIMQDKIKLLVGNQ